MVLKAITKSSMFQVKNGWNIETLIDFKGIVNYINCTTVKAHFSAAVRIDILNNTVKLNWNEGIGVNETTFIPEEIDVDKILEWVDTGITDRMVQEAVAVKRILRNTGYIAYD